MRQSIKECESYRHGQTNRSPINLYGRFVVSDKLFTASNAYAGEHELAFLLFDTVTLWGLVDQ